MQIDDFNARFEEIQRKVQLEIEAIETGKPYRSAAEIEAFIAEIWEGIKDFRSDFVFEFTDGFRTLCNAAYQNGLDETACVTFAFIHEQLAKKMVNSEKHRDFLFERFASRLKG